MGDSQMQLEESEAMLNSAKRKHSALKVDLAESQQTEATSKKKLAASASAVAVQQAQLAHHQKQMATAESEEEKALKRVPTHDTTALVGAQQKVAKEAQMAVQAKATLQSAQSKLVDEQSKLNEAK